jgi:sugar lactone lactonase YvrE
MSAALAVANYHCVVGENPLWNERERRIYWEDIETGRLFRADHESLEHECFYQGPTIGGFSFQADGSLLLFEADRIAVLDGEGRRRVIREGIDPEMRRFNDVIADPEGRVYAGSIGSTNENGGLYRIDLDGSVAPLFKGTGIANGMGFSPDLQRFYWTCSTTRTIFVFDYDRGSGELANRRVFHRARPAEGTPDGLAVDAGGAIWTARWDGFAVLCMTQEAAIVETVRFPVPKVSSVTFGGPALDHLYVTTAGGKPGSETADGTLYRVKVSARGRSEFVSRIKL